MKLVRDKIPEIMDAKGKKPIIHTASADEFKRNLIEKLNEEVLEIKKELNAEELADLLEVIYSLGKLIWLTPQDLEKIRIKKAEENGDFSKKIILENPK
ncbi:MAG: nucleoside triphosphate pyrophosphohydrolase [Candidatus Diapherotrites archaeon]|nr:nucleoside triphosphate pyrophosphohydrolase [Candidatus Diapherotrites archaeon]